MEKVATKNTRSTKKTWPMVRLGDIGTITRGSGIKRSETVERGRPCLRYGEIYTSFNVILGKPKSFVPQEVFDRSVHIKHGDLVFTLTGENTEEIAKTLAYLGDEEIAAGGDLAVWANHGCDPMYLAYLMYSPALIKAKAEASNGQIIVHASVRKIQDIQIPLPPLTVQREIVARLEKELGEADALEAKFKDIAENADAEFKAELDETFKGLDGARNCFETSCCMKRGEYITRKEARCGNIPVILGGKEPAYFIDRSNHDGECLVISRSGASAGFVSYWNEPIFVTDGFIIEVKENTDIRFAYYYYQSLYEQLGKCKNGSAIPHVTGSGIQALGFPGTSLLVQKEIVTKLDAVREKCDRLKAAAERGLRAAEDLRKSILAEAFEQ